MGQTRPSDSDKPSLMSVPICLAKRAAPVGATLKDKSTQRRHKKMCWPVLCGDGERSGANTCEHRHFRVVDMVRCSQASALRQIFDENGELARWLNWPSDAVALAVRDNDVSPVVLHSTTCRCSLALVICQSHITNYDARLALRVRSLFSSLTQRASRPWSSYSYMESRRPV